MTKRTPKLIIVKDESEVFTKSTCDCNFCISMHHSQIEWDSFTPQTPLQFGMKDVVSRLEKKIEKVNK